MEQLTDTPLILKRFLPLIRSTKIRAVIGFFLLVIVFATICALAQKRGIWINIIWIVLIAWVPSIFLTDKYIHKYPQRYTSYLFISHFKAFCVMGFFLTLLKLIGGLPGFSWLELSMGFLAFSLLDAAVSYPRKIEDIDRNAARRILKSMSGTQLPSDNNSEIALENVVVETAVVNNICQSLSARDFSAFIQNYLPHEHDGNRNFCVCDDTDAELGKFGIANKLNAIVCTTRMNDVRRLNLFLEHIVNHLAMGGYFVMHYTPLENVYSGMRKKHGVFGYRILYLFHFLWFRAVRKIPFVDKAYFSSCLRWLDKVHLAVVKRRNRALSKAEMWGRLAFWGMDVIAESQGEKERCIIARRLGNPHPNRFPSYYPIIALAKVGLDGKVLRMHKMRSMYAFSEFIQNRIFQDQGLTETGKFKNDFRLTEYGKFIRRYWIDELPQFYDWLKGDIKLVGMRATSAHYLSLYPQALYDLYIQVKPGLISPIFDQSTTEFAQIVKVELDYLKSYIQNPFKADLKCFVQTFTDIFFRGVRSK